MNLANHVNKRYRDSKPKHLKLNAVVALEYHRKGV